MPLFYFLLILWWYPHWEWSIFGDNGIPFEKNKKYRLDCIIRENEIVGAVWTTYKN